MKKTIIAGLAALVAVSLGVALYNPGTEAPATDVSQQTSEQSEPITFSEDGKSVTYQGEEGVTALETLKSLTDVTIEESSFGEFVTAINGVEADDSKEFWAFHVNGTLADEGAGAYVAQPGDTFEWKIEQFE